MKNGVIIVNKEEGISSFAAVNRVKRLFEVKKAGHTGTLDPMATGVLPILLGRAVKASEYMLSSNKHYVATLLLGIATDTEDVTGKILFSSDEKLPEEKVLEAINSMLGDSMQTPPMYSAVKVGGKKLYELAREGREIEREARKITVYSINTERINESEYKLDIICSKGTYIRTLCSDIGKKLRVGAVMKTLKRVEAAGFTIENAVSLDDLEKMSKEDREACVFPVESVFKNEKRVTLSPFFSRLARCGVEIYLKKINASFDLKERVLLFDEKGFFALGEVQSFENGLAIKPIKQFDV